MDYPRNVSHLIILLFLGITGDFVEANFIVTVKFINYTNPSGLCAECNKTLDEVGLANIVPACCERPSLTDACRSTVQERCETRFRWTLRGFGESLETRPVKKDEDSAYFFNPCKFAYARCPFRETSQTFKESNIAFLGRANPNSLSSTSPWTGQIQFFVEAVHKSIPNIIDSFLINLDSMKLSSNFTTERTFTGYHHISEMTMAFRVDCATNYYGPECTLHCEESPGVWLCDENGKMCLRNGYDPVENCSQCLPNRNLYFNCSSCVPGFVGDNCSASSTGLDNTVVLGTGVAGVLVVLMILCLVVALVAIACIIRKDSKKTSSGGAVNLAFEIGDLDETDDANKSNSHCSSLHEHSFENPLYTENELFLADEAIVTDEGNKRNSDYSIPWDCKPFVQHMVVTPSHFSHMIARKVKSYEPRVEDESFVKKCTKSPLLRRSAITGQYDNASWLSKAAGRHKDNVPSLNLDPSIFDDYAKLDRGSPADGYNYAEIPEKMATIEPDRDSPADGYDYAEIPDKMATAKPDRSSPVDGYDYAEIPDKMATAEPDRDSPADGYDYAEIPDKMATAEPDRDSPADGYDYAEIPDKMATAEPDRGSPADGYDYAEIPDKMATIEHDEGLPADGYDYAEVADKMATTERDDSSPVDGYYDYAETPDTSRKLLECATKDSGMHTYVNSSMPPDMPPPTYDYGEIPLKSDPDPLKLDSNAPPVPHRVRAYESNTLPRFKGDTD